MRDRMTQAIEELGGEPDVEVVVDDSWSTDRITPRGVEKLRGAGFAPPAPREAGVPKLVQLRSAVFRCPLLRIDRDEAGEHLRPDPVPLDPLLRELPSAVRAVQDDLVGRRADPSTK
jgi:metal-sulfur cluster biosynthetic enzyme